MVTPSVLVIARSACGVIVSAVQVCWPSTVAQAEAEGLLGLVDVNVEFAVPNVIVPLGGDIVPLVALHATGIFGTTLGGVFPRAAAAELCVMSAVIVDVPPAGTGLGEALVPSTIQGLELSTPVLPANTRVPLVVAAQPAPVAPGP